MMNVVVRRRGLSLAVVAALAMMSGLPAGAQEAAAPPGADQEAKDKDATTLSEIVVTSADALVEFTAHDVPYSLG